MYVCMYVCTVSLVKERPLTKECPPPTFRSDFLYRVKVYSNERLPTRLAIQSVVCHQDSISKPLVITLYIINSDMGALSWLNVKERTCKVLHPWALSQVRQNV